MTPVTVLVVDDSNTVRAVLRRVLEASPGIRVVGEAADGREAVEQTLRLRPDAVVMDLDLPGMDGFAATEQIMARRPTPIIVVTSKVRRDEMQAAFEAMKRGAVGVFPKPEVPDQWRELSEVLPETIRQLGSRVVARAAGSSTTARPGLGRRLRYLAMGASTGGPGAIRQVLAELGRRSSLGIAIVQHIAAGFEEGFADWLARELDVDVAIARDGEELGSDMVRIARSGQHLRVDGGGRLNLDDTTPPVSGHRPSVDELFRSFLQVRPQQVAAVLLTGMGSDGAEGMLELHRAGALTVAQDEASSAVFGMPRSALERGATDLALPPSEIGRLLVRTLGEGAA